MGMELDVRHEHMFPFRPDGHVHSFACRCLPPRSYSKAKPPRLRTSHAAGAAAGHTW